MKQVFLLALVLTAFAGCSTTEKYAANQAATSQWLAANAGSARYSLDGAWEAVEYGWGGAGRFEQSGNRVAGMLGDYQIDGVINGNTVYLAFVSSGWTYYTARLTRRGDTLGGFYSSTVPFTTRDGSLTLRRVGD